MSDFVIVGDMFGKKVVINTQHIVKMERNTIFMTQGENICLSEYTFNQLIGRLVK